MFGVVKDAGTNLRSGGITVSLREASSIETKNIRYHRNQFGSVDRALVCGLKGPRFDSGQGHVHWLQAHPQ